MTLENKTVLITGGTGDIGRATAVAAAERGAKVVVAGRDTERGAAAVSAIEQAGSEGLFISTDVTSVESIHAMVEQTVQHFGSLDCAFNNAGLEGVPASVHEIQEENWHKMLDTKLTGVWRSMKAELLQMLQHGNGSIVNMAGNWGLVGFPEYGAYCAAAHGVMGLTKAAAKEYGRKNIRVNAVCPAAVDTALLDRMVGGNDEIKNSFGDYLAMGRIAKPDEVAQSVVWLFSEDSSYVTGEALVLDGG